MSMENHRMLMLSPYTYGRRRESGLLYPGMSEEKKPENSYNVVFADNTGFSVDEKNRVWLGLYRLPTYSSPKSPIVPSVQAIAGKQETQDDLLTKKSESLRLFKKENIWFEDKRGIIRCNNEESCLCSQYYRDSLQKAYSYRTRGQKGELHQTQTARSSVLRLNKKALSVEISKENKSSELKEIIDDRSENRLISKGVIIPPYQRRTVVSPPSLSTPSTAAGEPPPLFFCNPYKAAAFDEMKVDEWSEMVRRDVGGGKRRRRDNMKKCRKVYGIDNRNLWCTQCKWKKACTRFQLSNFSPRYFSFTADKLL